MGLKMEAKTGVPLAVQMVEMKAVQMVEMKAVQMAD